MPIKTYKPYTPSRRGMTSADFSELTTDRPEKSLVVALDRKGGRNNTGSIMVRHQGGGRHAVQLALADCGQRLTDFDKGRKTRLDAPLATGELVGFGLG